ncbi:MAG: hypothetical protein BGO97_01585 [Micrococcales bacterium 70-64]|nr:hypothetical protein [Leifsonia sp.]ODU65908.1 MAG: hypothetical protein ABT06_01590 [Leifsonia sp. SCN 70-46]OJX84534.1 MAG: hypothetical protein BGO97_01585 [Micrococcales bacterium 70-64]
MSWLRRNIAALIVIVVSLPALATVLVVVPLLDQPADDVRVVQPGDTAQAAGYSFTLTASQEFEGTDDNGIPVGTSLIGALIDVTRAGGTDELSCDADLTSRAGGTERSWTTVSSPRDFGYGVGDDSETTCYLEDEPFQYETVFLVPSGTYDGATIDISVGSTVLRMELEQG